MDNPCYDLAHHTVAAVVDSVTVEGRTDLEGKRGSVVVWEHLRKARRRVHRVDVVAHIVVAAHTGEKQIVVDLPEVGDTLRDTVCFVENQLAAKEVSVMNDRFTQDNLRLGCLDHYPRILPVPQPSWPCVQLDAS